MSPKQTSTARSRGGKSMSLSEKIIFHIIQPSERAMLPLNGGMWRNTGEDSGKDTG